MTLSPSGPRRDEITTCRKCHAEIMFLRTAKRADMPVNVVVTKRPYRNPNSGETTYVRGEHEPHWGTCTAASAFRKPR